MLNSSIQKVAEEQYGNSLQSGEHWRLQDRGKKILSCCLLLSHISNGLRKKDKMCSCVDKQKRSKQLNLCQLADELA